jgi:hypothetical protein
MNLNENVMKYSHLFRDWLLGMIYMLEFILLVVFVADCYTQLQIIFFTSFAIFLLIYSPITLVALVRECNNFERSDYDKRKRSC